MVRAIRIALALLVLGAPVAHAQSLPASAAPSIIAGGTVITATVGKDFGGYWDIGTQGSLGSSMKATAGKSMGAWVKVHDNTVSPLMMTWWSVSGMPNLCNGIMINTTWTTDYNPQANSAIVTVCGTDGDGWGFRVDLSGTPYNDSKYHHHMVVWSGLTTGKPTSWNYYLDGVAHAATADFSDTPALTGTVSDFTLASYIGADRKGASSNPIDCSTIDVEDMRIYTRALTAAEVKEIVKQRGRDNIRGSLLSRYPFWVDGKNTGPNGVAATPHNNAGGSSNPTIETTKAMSAARKRIMRIDVQRLLDDAANDNRENSGLREPRGRVAA